MFSTHPEKNFCFWVKFILSSATALNLGQSQILSFVKGLIKLHLFACIYSESKPYLIWY